VADLLRLLAWRSLWDRPRRTLALLLGYGIGVAVMIALLSVGDALLAQSRDRDLVAGGDVVLLPEGVDPAVLKVNGVTDMDFTIQQAGFIVREVLGGPRFTAAVAAAAPELGDREIYVRARGAVRAGLASGGIPSLDAAAGVTARVPGAEDTARDRAWLAPSRTTLLDRLDRFHAPPEERRRSWAEWDYFNFLDPARGTYGYLTLFAGGEGRGGILLRLRRPGRPVDDIAIPVLLRPGDLNLRSATQRIGPARVVNDAGSYHITIDDPRLGADLRLAPDPGFSLPPAQFAGGALASGYVVPAVRGSINGYLRTPRGEVRLTGAPAYHDHNWGTWQGVTWEWGEAGGAGGAALYGGLHVAGADAGAARGSVLFLWRSRAGSGLPGAGPARGGFLGAFAVRRIVYSGWRPGPWLLGRAVPAPSAVDVEAAAGGGDRVAMHIRVTDVLASLASQPGAPPDAAGVARAGPARPAFLQLRGTAVVSGTVDGEPVDISGPAAAETFVRLADGRRGPPAPSR
jgi:hypothetical protein